MHLHSLVSALLILRIVLVLWFFVLAMLAHEPFLWWAIRRWIAARGWVRPSVWLAHLCRSSFEHDRRGGPVLAGALALLARPTHDERLATWLEGQLGAATRSGRRAWSRPA